ncbi:MAG: outer membrane protein assembly factor BamD [Pirellulaceae bacterium]|nr:outer membrane protein assembly factor BamD [Pirellulaceae bacterium]
MIVAVGRRRIVLVTSVVVPLASWLAAAEPSTAKPQPAAAPPSLIAICNLIQDRDYAAATAAIDGVIQGGGGNGTGTDRPDRSQSHVPPDHLLYLKGRAAYYQNKHDAAVAVFEDLGKRFPDSPWARPAKWAAAAALVRKGDYRAAELIYRAQTEWLLSPDRKQELAEIYVDLAAALFDPPQRDRQPDYAQAREFYEKALDIGPRPDRRAAIELQVGRCCEEQKKPDEAVKRYEQLARDHADAPEAIDARYHWGQCLLAADRPAPARRVWQDLLAEHGDSKSDDIPKAAFGLAYTWKIPEPETDQQLELGVAARQAFLERFPQDVHAGRAHLEIAQSYVHRSRYEDAVTQLTKFLADERYRGSEHVPPARNLLGQAYQRQKKFVEAQAAWREYLAQHPADAGWSHVQQQVIDTEHALALEKYQTKDYDAARKLLAEFQAKYPLDRRNAGIVVLLGQMHREQRQFDAALAEWRRAVSKYPLTDESSFAQYLIGQTLETDLARPGEAQEEYGKVRWGRHRSEAVQAIERLAAKSLTVVTQRVFRTDETPCLQVTTRNVPAVQVRAYKVDLEAYFRKRQSGGGVENLDIALIDPNVSFEFRIPNYAPCLEWENALEIPLPAGMTAGSLAVTVSSETLEATTLVIRSDLDMIVKASHREVFVWAENMLTGKPWPGAKLLVSDGQSILAEGVTGADGVFRSAIAADNSTAAKRAPAAGKPAGRAEDDPFAGAEDDSFAGSEDDPLAESKSESPRDVRVIAVAAGHVASNEASLRDLAVAQGLSDKGYIYTDRPAYRAGQQVFVRGCLRRAVDDVYTIEADKRYTLEILDPRNRTLWQQAVVLNAFGSFQAEFPLPPACPAGQYRIQVSDKTGRQEQGGFQVHEYQLDPVRLVVDAPRRIFCRGEQIEGVIRVEYYYGAPLTGRSVTYQLGDDRQHTAVTNDQGEVAFRLPTREFAESQTLPLNVQLPERNLQTSVNFQLVMQAFALRVQTAREVFVAGETFEVTIAAQSMDATPASQKLTLKVLEVTNVNGQIGERLVEQVPLETAPADGLARHTLKLAAGGQYRLRAEAIDRFGHPVSGQHALLVSDDQDRHRLRILADRHTFKAGDMGEVTLLWRDAPALALVTFQGAIILDHQLVPLETGANKLPVLMKPELAPNFDLAVAVMTDVRLEDEANARGKPIVRFHESSSPFDVVRELDVRIAVRRPDGAAGPPRPGEPVEVSIATTDLQGRPVAAEVSLTMVEQALLDCFDWPLPSIQEFFRGARRQSALRTTSSITFAYHPETKPIAAWLLTEQQRQELARQEAETLQRRMTMNAPAVGVGGSFGMGGFGGGFGGGAEEPSVTSVVPGADASGDSVGKLIDLIAAEPGASDQTPSPQDMPAVGLNLVVSQTQDAEPGKTKDVANLANRETPADDSLGDETGYWNPRVVTGADGQAKVSFVVPPRTAAWTLLAKGISQDTLAGEATIPLVAKKELFGQLKLPAAFTVGDQAAVIASVHREAAHKRTLEVTLKVEVGSRTVEQKETLEAAGKGIFELPFHVDLAAQVPPAPADTAVFELTIAAGDLRDVVRRVVPLQPYGRTVYATAGGQADADTTAWVEPAPGMPAKDLRLQVLVAPSVSRSLVDAVLGPPLACQQESLGRSADVETATSDLLAALALQQVPAAIGPPDGAVALAVDARIRAAIGRLVGAQNENGGWGWTRSGTFDAYASARVLWALSLAKRAGYSLPAGTYERLLQCVIQQASQVENSDYESKTILLHALAVAGHGDFPLANRLYRERPALSTPALLYLALAMMEMDRPAIAAELLAMLAGRNLDADVTPQLPEAGGRSWTRSPVELRALYALAAQAATPPAANAGELVDWLLAHRTGHRWLPDKATGPAMWAVCRGLAGEQRAGERYRLTIAVNGQDVTTLDLDPTQPTQLVDVPQPLLKPGKQQVQLRVNGRGRFVYQAVLGGLVPADQLKSTTAGWTVKRVYEPALLQREGREVPRGFSADSDPKIRFRNPLTQLPVGERGRVELQLARRPAGSGSPPPPEYLVVTESIPAGTSVIEASVQGEFERFEIQPGAIVGYLPGTFRAAPTLAQNVYAPDQLAVSEPKSLTILPSGQKSADPYRLSPLELHALGQLAAAQGDWQTAAAHLTELIANWAPDLPTYQQAAGLLLDAQLQLNEPAEAVRYFEIIAERWPDQQVPYAKLLRIGAAYHELGEFERSYLVFRAVAESNFTLESGVAGFLASKNEFLPSVAVLERLLGEYPPEPYAAAARAALAQQLLAKAPAAQDDPELREAKVNRIDLVFRAWRMLDDFLTVYPEDPAADQAAFSAANALLELGRYADAAVACERYAARYPQSKLLDSFWYIIGFGRFADGRHEQAGTMLRQVAEAKPIDKASGLPADSPNKWPAIYILGQIFHSLGQPAEAIRYYRQVEDRYPDAKKSIAYFLRKAVHVPELTTVRPGQPAELELEFRNLPACEMKVYRIDLMKFALLRQDLLGVAQINLAGIDPQQTATVRLGDGQDYRNRTQRIKLDLQDEGAYLVVCRGDDRYASGLVLITPWELEVQHDPVAREVRATVKDAASGQFVNGVQVKITATGNAEFVSGTTDRRGMFAAQGIVGAPTVIAQAAAGRYAFYRSPAAVEAAAGWLPADLAARLSAAGQQLAQGAAAAAPASAGRTKSAGVALFEGNSPAEQKIRAALDAPTALAFEQTPLQNVAQTIAQRHDIPVELDRRALDDIGVAKDVPVTFNARGIGLRSALKNILRELGLTFEIRDEVLLITTPEEAESRLTTVAYPVTDLVGFRDSKGETWSDFDTLIDIITGTVAPQSWDTVGGPGSVEGTSVRNTDVIILSQTQEVHEQIAELLERLRAVAGGQPAAGEPPVRDQPARPAAPAAGFGGGMGMGGYFGGPASPGAPGTSSPAAGATATDLLKGLQDEYRTLQGRQLEQLQRMYQQGQGMGGGMGGVNAGGVF